MGDMQVRTYTVNGENYTLYRCYEDDGEESDSDFYDLYDSKGNCLNEGDPYYEIPSRSEIVDLIEMRKS
jgi:hypothetical protein